MYRVNIILFHKFETLDVFGPVEIFGCLPDEFTMEFYTITGGLIKSTQGVQVMTKPIDEGIFEDQILFVPGGAGTRDLVYDDVFVRRIESLSQVSKYTLSVCTGAAILASSDVLNDRKATTNKRAFEWVASLNDKVIWNRKARWVVDGNIYTSSGVSAGMDMTLGFISDMFGRKTAEDISYRIEYTWHNKKDNDPFSRIEA